MDGVWIFGSIMINLCNLSIFWSKFNSHLENLTPHPKFNSSPLKSYLPPNRKGKRLPINIFQELLTAMLTKSLGLLAGYEGCMDERPTSKSVWFHRLRWPKLQQN